MTARKLRPNNNLHRKDRTLSAYLEIAIRAARDARLLHVMASNEEEALALIALVLHDHTQALKTSWLRQRNGGINGWLRFLELMGLREKLTLERLVTDRGAGGTNRTQSTA